MGKIPAKIIAELDDKSSSYLGPEFTKDIWLAVIPCGTRDYAHTAAKNTKGRAGYVMKVSKVLSNGFGNPDVEEVNSNRSLVDLPEEEKLTRFQEMLAGLMAGLGIKGKIRRKDGYFKITYEEEEHKPLDALFAEDSDACGSEKNPHLVLYGDDKCFICNKIFLSFGLDHFVYDNTGTGSNFSQKDAVRVDNARKTTRIKCASCGGTYQSGQSGRVTIAIDGIPMDFCGSGCLDDYVKKVGK